MLPFKKFSCILLAMFLPLVTSPAKSLTPTPIYSHDYAGPYIACRPGIAVPVKAGEKLQSIGSTDMLYFSDGQLTTDTFLEDPVRDADIVQFRGPLDVPGLGLVTRYELTSRNSDYRSIGYVFDTGKPYFTGHYQALFRSPQFTGTDADVAILARAISGAEAETMCARHRQ